MVCLLNFFIKGLDFVLEEREKVYVFLRGLVCGIIIVKKEKDILEVFEGEVLVEKDNNVFVFLNLNLFDNEIGYEVYDFFQLFVVKKLKLVDIDDWLEDVVCVGESLDVGSVVEYEIKRYLGCQIDVVDYNLIVLEWWKKNFLFFFRILILVKKFLVILVLFVLFERVFSFGG